jgi:lipoprotein-anchoring transpeptidase ErfK/SrfK
MMRGVAELTPWPSDKDIVIGKVLYMPPLGTPYRAQRGVPGPYRLNLGGSIGLHGALDKESVGKAVTHGCMRLLDKDVTWLYRNVPIGTLVFIY